MKDLIKERDELYTQIPARYRRNIERFYVDVPIEIEVEGLRKDAKRSEEYWAQFDKYALDVNDKLVKKLMEIKYGS